jgi:TonB family protein
MSAVPRVSHLQLVPESAPEPFAAARPGPAPAAPGSTGTPGSAGDGGAPVDVVALTADMDLFAATREAVGECNPVWRARTAEEAADLLITGRCGVLLLDMACVSVRADTLIMQIAEQFPDVVVCVAGTRADEPLLAPLISEGLVHRFMHKPASARRAGMFLQAAVRRHVERRDGTAKVPMLPMFGSLARPATGLPRKYLVALALLVLVATVPLFVGHDESPLVIDPADAPTAAVTAAAPVEPAVATATRADPVLSRARAALQAGRLEAPEGRNALDLFAAVLLAQPGHAEAQAGLERTIDQLLERARAEAAASRKAEAERLLQRVLAIAPRHEATLALLAELNPPDLPSLQLAREEEALARVLSTTVSEPVPVPVETQAATPRLRVPVTDLSAAVPVTRLPTTTPPPPVVRPDPLAPRYTNSSTGATTLTRPRTYGGRVANPLPTAGSAAPATSSRAATSALAPQPPAPELLRVPADSLDRIAARDPVYPPQALRNGTRGWVELEFTITPAGTVRDIQVVAAEPAQVFDAAATEALSQWRFRPRVVNGQAVPQRSSVTMRFDVDG